MKNLVKNALRPLYISYRQMRTKQKVSQVLAKKEDILLEIGSGNRQGKNGWLTLDINRSCDIFWDLRKGIPFPDESIAKIYSSHLFEHLTFRESQALLDECLRVLIPGGIFSICVPNARIYIEAYLNPETKLDNKYFFNHRPAYNQTTRIDFINYTAYMNGGHKYMFDEENLIHILKAKKMKNVHLREFDNMLDRVERDYESIYAEAEKPQ